LAESRKRKREGKEGGKKEKAREKRERLLSLFPSHFEGERMSLREDIRAFAQAARSPVLPVPTPELPQYDGQIGVTRVCARAIASYWKDQEDDEVVDERAGFVVLVACDLDGNKIFQAEDVLWLSTCAALSPMVERLYWAGREHNGLTEENRRAWRKNSASTAGGGSPSSSAAPSPPVSVST
jgi:hypothetical protein